jgi:hypothetical protein
VLGTLAEVRRILVSGNPWAQRAVMEALLDLGGTFVPEAGHATYQGDVVQGALNAFIQSLRPEVAPLADAQDARASSAKELLELMDDRAA